jgi:benzylsuccinate CoA-transferase BbsE subunit
MSDAALAELRVLDLSGPMGNYCGKMFAELGADVVLVEPPDGTPLRHEPPFADDEPGPERSLAFFANNTSKRSVRLDLEQEPGQAAFRDLAERAHLVIETAPPGWLSDRGIGYDDLRLRNPALVLTSITPFGQTGPYAGFEADDLVCLALGGMLSLGGYADGPPVRTAQNQAYAAGNLFGAVASMLGVIEAEGTGEGQHVDVSVQEAVVMGMENAVQFYDLEGRIRRRTGGQQRQAGAGLFPCADGFVYMLAGGIGGNRFWPNLVEWLRAEGVENVDAISGPEWGRREFVDLQSSKDLFASVFHPFCADRSKADLYHAAQRWRVPLCPVNSPADIVASAQLRARDYFVSIPGLGRDQVLVPGAPYVLSETPWSTCSAPGLGEHTDEVLAEIGYAPDLIRELREKGVV